MCESGEQSFGGEPERRGVHSGEPPTDLDRLSAIRGYGAAANEFSGHTAACRRCDRQAWWRGRCRTGVSLHSAYRQAEAIIDAVWPGHPGAGRHNPPEDEEESGMPECKCELCEKKATHIYCTGTFPDGATAKLLLRCASHIPPGTLTDSGDDE